MTRNECMERLAIIEIVQTSIAEFIVKIVPVVTIFSSQTSYNKQAAYPLRTFFTFSVNSSIVSTVSVIPRAFAI